MALSKPSSFLLKTLLSKTLTTKPPPTLLHFRSFSFATPEEAAADRRKRKRHIRIEPPLSSLRQNQTQQPSQPKPQNTINPNAPKLPEPVSALTGTRLTLHNKILKLVRENDLEEAALFTRHSIYSNCRPTIHTVNVVLSAQFRQGKYSELLSLHRFITQAGVAGNVVTVNVLLSVYFNCRKVDLALEQYKQLVCDAPFNPNTTTFRILVKGLVDNKEIDKAIELKDEMEGKGFKTDATVYSYLMLGRAKDGNGDAVLELFEELKRKLGVEEVLDGVVYGNLMKGYFLKGMETEAMECYERVLREGSGVKMSAVAYNYVLEALSKNGKFEEALKLFERMKGEHDPPRKLSVNLGSYNVVVDGFCAEKRFSEAIEVFDSMGEKRCSPDTLSYNVLIDLLCSNGKFAEAEELYKGMADKKVNPDEYTFITLMDTCLKKNRHDDASQYFTAMVESKLRPNIEVYNRLVGALVEVGKVDEAKSFFDLMLTKLRMNDDAYKFMMNALFEVGKHDEVLKVVDWMLREEPNDFSEEVEEFVIEGLKKEGREDEVANLKSEIEREKAEAAAKAAEEAERVKASATASIASLLPFKSSVADKDGESKELGEEATEALALAEKESGDEVSEDIISSNNNMGATVGEVEGSGEMEQVTV